MKKKFFRSCFALLLSMVLLFGGVRWDAAAIGDVSPFGPVRPTVPVSLSVTAPQSVMAKGDVQQLIYDTDPTGGSLTWSSSNTSVATVNSSGLVTAVAVGNVTITGRYVYNGTAYTDSVSLIVANIPVGLRNNTDYYLVNYSSGRLMGVANTSDADLTNVQTVTPTSSAWYQWTIELQSDGRFQLINKGSPTDKCLDLSDVNIDIYTQADRDSMKFTIQRVTSGEYAGLYLIKYGNNFVVEKSDHNVAIQSWYTPGCYWSVMKVNKGDAELYGFNYTYGNLTSPSTFYSMGGFNELESSLDNLGYDAVQKTNQTYSNSYYSMSSDDIYIYVGHATYGMITFHGKNTNAQDVITGAIVAHNAITAVPSNSLFVNNMGDNALSGARCIFYLGCLSGAPAYINTSQSYNLVDETFDQGAHFVLGAIANIIDGNTTDWLIAFAESVQAGNNLESSINYANNSLEMYTYDVGETGNTITCKGLPLYPRGDGKQYLNFQ